MLPERANSSFPRRELLLPGKQVCFPGGNCCCLERQVCFPGGNCSCLERQVCFPKGNSSEKYKHPRMPCWLPDAVCGPSRAAQLLAHETQTGGHDGYMSPKFSRPKFCLDLQHAKITRKHDKSYLLSQVARVFTLHYFSSAETTRQTSQNVLLSIVFRKGNRVFTETQKVKSFPFIDKGDKPRLRKNNISEQNLALTS